MLDPTNLENWSVLPNDNALPRVVTKQIKRSKNKETTIIDYQKDQLSTAISFVKSFSTAIDGGANYGLMSYHLSKMFKTVHAFEIESQVRGCLKKNIENFNLNNVKIYESGLGESNKNVNLVYGKSSFATHIDPSGNFGNSNIVSIDSLLLSSLDFIKLDCEGYEPFILKGGETTIKKFSPVILMERKGHTERWNLHKNSPVELLEKWGYVEVVSYEKDCIMIRE